MKFSTWPAIWGNLRALSHSRVWLRGFSFSLIVLGGEGEWRMECGDGWSTSLSGILLRISSLSSFLGFRDTSRRPSPGEHFFLIFSVVFLQIEMITLQILLVTSK